jgi:hypothetical protein
MHGKRFLRILYRDLSQHVESEDHLLHAFKHKGPCPEGRTLLAQESLHDRELIAVEEEVESDYDSDQDDDEDENADL